MDSEMRRSDLRLIPPLALGNGSREAGTTYRDAEESSADDELLRVAIGLVKSAGHDGPSHFAAQVALVFEALRRSHRG